MEYFLLLSLSTLAIGLLTLAIYLKTRSLTFPVGIAALYFWSLFGAWFLVYDKLGGTSPMHYFYLEKKVVTVFLDSDYLLSLAYYTIFILAVGFALLRLAKPAEGRIKSPFVLSHWSLLFVALASGLAGYLMVFYQLESAAEFGRSGYFVLAGQGPAKNPLFYIHKTLNRIGLTALALGVAIRLANEPRWISAPSSRAVLPAYAVLFCVFLLYCVVIGNKNELFFAAMAGTFFYLMNAPRPNWIWLGGIAALAAEGLALVDALRGTPISQLSLSSFEGGEESLFHWLFFLFTSNEAYGAHLSMYAVLSNKVELTYGTSLISLACSIVPRFLWPNRYPDIYPYYASKVAAKPDQGYSIHHATAWYLNFGPVGVIVGGLVLGMVWATAHNALKYVREGSKGSVRDCILILAGPFFLATIPSLIRTGIEGYKGAMVDVVFVPAMIFGSARFLELGWLRVRGFCVSTFPLRRKRSS